MLERLGRADERLLTAQDKEPRPAVCACGAKLPGFPYGLGRPRKWCSEACRHRHYRGSKSAAALKNTSRTKTRRTTTSRRS